MAYSEPLPGSLKRKRRRRAEPVSLSARLQVVDTPIGDAAEVSSDLVEGLRIGAVESNFFLAIKEWTPSTPPSMLVPRWTILPCKPLGKDSAPAHSIVRVSTRSKIFPPLLENLKLAQAAHTRLSGAGLEVRVTDAVPIELNAIYVNVELGEDFGQSAKENGKHTGQLLPRKPSAPHLRANQGPNQVLSAHVDAATHDQIKSVVKASLAKLPMIHAGAPVRLSKLKDAKWQTSSLTVNIAACEPVAQGFLAGGTRIVLLLSDGRQLSTKVNPSNALPIPYKPPPQLLSEVEEDTSNEAFYTAVEDEGITSAPDTPRKAESPEDVESEEETDGNLSDDPDGLISLTSPALGSQTPGMMSAITVATPRPFGKHMNGAHTPGSVFSGMTSATYRGGQSIKTKVLRAQGLVERISEELLYPKPLMYEDEEARVYVDTTVLAKLGCFSGDWVEIVKAEDPAHSGIASLGASSFFDGRDEAAGAARAVKVFGLPDLLASKSAGKYPVHGRGRSGSISSFLGPTITPAVYLSPVLLTNLGGPTFLRLTPMRASEVQSMGRVSGKMPPSSLPPAAKEANLIKVQSPVSVEKAVDTSVFSGLVSYFESKQRLVKTGDLIAIRLDTEAGRALQDGIAAEEGAQSAVLNFFQSPLNRHDSDETSSKVVWFQVGAISDSGSEDSDQPDVWNGLVSMVPSKTKMHQSGTLQRKVPPALSSAWPFYEGLLPLPQARDARGALLQKPLPLSVTNLRRRLRELLSTATSPRAVHLGLPPMAILLHSTQRNIGKSYTATHACLDLGMHCFAIDAFDILTEAAGGGGDNNTVGTFESRAERALQCGAENTCLLIEHIDALSSDRMYTAIKDTIGDSRIFIATTTELDKVPENLRGLFTHELEMSAPDEGEREAILQSIISQSAVNLSPSVDLAAIAVKTAALVAGDLADVIDRAIASRQTRLEGLATKASETSPHEVTVRDLEIAGGDSALNLTAADFDIAVDEARKNFADSIGAPKIPNVQWSDVGGLANVKDAVIETIQLPLSRPELFAKGLKKRSGILFYGPPGTGKTLLAKAIATEFSLNFFSVKGPELLNMYIGESEANVRRVFQRARDARPCVVFFDELDSVAPKRGNQGDSGGVMDRIVSQLLAELDGMSDGDSEDGGGGAGVFVIGATNRPDLLDQALLRPGRFDKMLYLGVSDTHEKQQKILEALTRKFTLSPELQLSRIAASLPFTYTGADLYALCSDSMLKAVTRSARAVDDKIALINAERSNADTPKPGITVAQFFDHHATDADLDVLVTEEDFDQAHSELVPSVSAEELGHYERVRQDFEGGRDKEHKQGGQTNGTQPPRLPASATQEEVEAHHASFIDQLIANGFKDGSLARNDPKGKGKGKMNTISLASLSQAMNGRAADDESSDARQGSQASTRATDDDTEDSSDFVVRTGQINLNNGGSTGDRHVSNGATDGRPRERESRFFSSGREKERDKGKGKIGEKDRDTRRSGKSRTMSLFSKAKGKRHDGFDQDASVDSNGKGKSDFGDAARDGELYD